MRLRFLKTVQYLQADPATGKISPKLSKTYEKDKVYDLPDDHAKRWLRRGVAENIDFKDEEGPEGVDIEEVDDAPEVIKESVRKQRAADKEAAAKEEEARKQPDAMKTSDIKTEPVRSTGFGETSVPHKGKK